MYPILKMCVLFLYFFSFFFANCFQLWQLAYQSHSNTILKRQNEISQTGGCNGKSNSFLNEDDEVGAILLETASEFKTWVRLHQIQARFLLHLNEISVIEDEGSTKKDTRQMYNFINFLTHCFQFVCVYTNKSHWLKTELLFFSFWWQMKIQA